MSVKPKTDGVCCRVCGATAAPPSYLILNEEWWSKNDAHFGFNTFEDFVEKCVLVKSIGSLCARCIKNMDYWNVTYNNNLQIGQADFEGYLVWRIVKVYATVTYEGRQANLCEFLTHQRKREPLSGYQCHRSSCAKDNGFWVCGLHRLVKISRTQRPKEIRSIEINGRNLLFIFYYRGFIKGSKHTEEAKKKMKLAWTHREVTDKQRERMRKFAKSNKGIPRSAKTRAKISKSHTGKVKPHMKGSKNPKARKVCLISEYGERLVYNSLIEACEANSLKYDSLRASIYASRSYKGWTARYADKN